MSRYDFICNEIINRGGIVREYVCLPMHQANNCAAAVPYSSDSFGHPPLRKHSGKAFHFPPTPAAPKQPQLSTTVQEGIVFPFLTVVELIVPCGDTLMDVIW